MPPKNSKNSALLASIEPEPVPISEPDVPKSENSTTDSNKDTSKPKDAELETKTAKSSSESASIVSKDPIDPKDTSGSQSSPIPPLPPRRPPVERKPSAFTSNFSELKEAFPDSDENLLRAILVAASNNLEAAFTGMLALTDKTIRPATYVREQIKNDEELARKIAISEQRHQHRRRRAPRSRTYDGYEEESDRRGSATSFNDELYEGIQKGYSETKQAVTSIWDQFKQKLNGEIYDEEPEQVFGRRQGSGSSRSSWWPQQSEAENHTFISTEPQGDYLGDRPRLPERKPKTYTNIAAPETPAQSGKEQKSVNAFGDELDSTSKTDEPEPDAFFIGESDDDDLGSLNDEVNVPAGPKKISSPKKEKSPESEVAFPKKEKESTKKEDTASDTTTTTANGKTTERKNSTAKELLTKVQSSST